MAISPWKRDPFSALLLRLEGCNSLEEMLAVYCRVEFLDSRNLYRCDTCANFMPTSKLLGIEVPPEVLTIVASRFEKTTTSQTEKDPRPIRFRFTLDLRPYLARNGIIACDYGLVALVVHRGSSKRSGHYYCYALHSLTDQYVMSPCLLPPACS